MYADIQWKPFLASDWSPGGGPQQLSVVTTVWGVTTATQSGPQGSSNQGYTSQGIIPEKDVGVNTQFSTSYRLGTSSYGDGQGGMNGGPGGGGGGNSVTGGESQYGGALSAAAMVAAATATATATASVVALQERQDMNSQCTLVKKKFFLNDRPTDKFSARNRITK
ncbi:hypothetical protein Phum_PHUM129110 [Pediculus humanus corporis]|uniref:Uncharacterized protein n=1 Tax=Pediculus humanus subsp. corporis TaxID=121224 RepID=E0VE82_PEDHC|nr:uncharacterized protein Phum_PHUM129110 [Pediculus humanus corporis]EEB11688.1 hypothetical protein Phum_PHUM129110 [Pediculus humanus corporis]